MCKAVPVLVLFACIHVIGVSLLLLHGTIELSRIQNKFELKAYAEGIDYWLVRTLYRFFAPIQTAAWLRKVP